MTSIFSKITLFSTTLLLSTALIDSPAHAKGHNNKKHSPQKRVERLCKKLECSDSQRTQLHNLYQDMAKQQKAHKPAVKQLKKQMADEFRKPTPNKTELTRIFTELDSHHSRMKDRAQTAMFEIHKVLQPDQRSKMADIIERRGVHSFFGHHKKRSKNRRKNQQNKRN